MRLPGKARAMLAARRRTMNKRMAADVSVNVGGSIGPLSAGISGMVGAAYKTDGTVEILVMEVLLLLFLNH
ncbi:hypothetical protein [Chitiniphilus eburneus]|uniref:Uncharacterized protein n=1 Tax=Chitiniphilus eburneus TaxID=2571148 RepID=A0A4U0PXH4_9NEIS|nr:hypothetical protein [Chitiniphilus eburneus]TJZ72940.1 hypothetical protein FAZ21_12025 [Chitiniphilus eburneus]